MDSSSSIGIFDSGIGGLTVFREIANALPRENLAYLGDTARVPYGNKSPETVTRYALRNIEFLLKKNVKMVVMACNTASAFALTAVQGKFPIPILGVIGPGAEGALKATRSSRIGVIGTEGTIRSEAYRREIHSRSPQAFVTTKACPLFVPLVEEGWLTGDVPANIAQHYLTPMLEEKIDTLILGCTHYPLLKPILKKVVGESIRLIDSAEETSAQVVSELTHRNLLRKESTPPQYNFYVTDAPEPFRNIGQVFLKQPLLHVEHIEI